MRNFKVNDKVFCLMCGDGTVIQTDATFIEGNPIKVKFDTRRFYRHYTKTGEYYKDTSIKLLYHKDEFIKIKTEYAVSNHFNIGDKVHCLLYGEGQIVDILKNSDYPIEVEIKADKSVRTYSAEGQYANNTNKVLYHINEKPKVVVKTSNAIQAMQWLEEGKKIISDSFHEGRVYFFKNEENHIMCHCANPKKGFYWCRLCIADLFQHYWYEYKKCDFLQAISLYRKGFMITLGKYTLYLKDNDRFVLLNTKQKEIPIKGEQLLSENWEYSDNYTKD